METKIKKILVLGAGALKIGEAGEFDYSGSQALKALKEENITTVLINPNIATVQTSEDIADKIYFLPVTPYFVEQVIKKEKPDGIMLSFGGQTALNCGVNLFKNNILDKYRVEVLGTPVQAILDTEDRDLFVKKLEKINVDVPKSIACNTLEEVKIAAYKINFPIIIRAGFSLGGLGSGFCFTETELLTLAQKAFAYSPQILVEESLKGWKEIEYEVIRDKYDNCITVCNMENLDPLGIHTGESIVVAPSQTLTNSEYQLLREISFKIIRHLGIVGECNVQFALDPNSEDYKVIEVNARLSRSSALASKATGYPIAFIAAKLGLGYGLQDIKNSITLSTSAFFEPALDYIVCKLPRWDLNKFKGVSKKIGSNMKSVGEVMSIGKNFEEAIQKGLRMLGQGMHGFVGNENLLISNINNELSEPTDIRIFAIAKALNNGQGIDEIHDLTKVDKWFLHKLKNIIEIQNELLHYNSLEDLPDEVLLNAKKKGFSDFQIARFVLKDKNISMENEVLLVRNERKKRGILPFVKQIDTLAGEFPAQTNYLYMTYCGSEHDIIHEKDNKSIIVLGSGAYRIGSSVEFDWCSVNAATTIRNCGYRSIMVNCNPETVSTDYDICDKLYFEELTNERVMDILDFEEPLGTIVSMGGQTPNNLAMKLFRQNYKILGTSPMSIDMAEDRNKFSELLDKLDIDQPEWRELTNIKDIYEFADSVSYPLLVRPSYVLSGSAMNVVYNESEMEQILNLAASVSKQYPVVISKYVDEAKEIEMDAVANNGKILAYAISEHIEFAGVHSGDSTMLCPPQKINVETTQKINGITTLIAKELKITGPFNIQFLVKENFIKVIECNLRASRSFPFVSKVLKLNLIELATKAILGNKPKKTNISIFDLSYIGVKAPQFSFSRLQSADLILGVEMASTGEVGCFGKNYNEAVLCAMLSVGYTVPKKNILLSIDSISTIKDFINSVKLLKDNNFDVYATFITNSILNSLGIEIKKVGFQKENGFPNIMEMIQNRYFELIINIPNNLNKDDYDKNYFIRRNSIDLNIPLITNSQLAIAFINSFINVKINDIPIQSWDEM